MKTNCLLTLLCLAGLAACSADRAADEDSAPMAVTIMTFNVENLFDNVDDPGKDDKTYLPIAAKQNEKHVAECNVIEVERWRNDCLTMDWSDAILDNKLTVVAEAIRQVDGGADVIAFQEVENRAILDRLADDYLDGLGYGDAILIEGQDLRGIDVAFLSKLPLVGRPVLHRLTFDDHPERQADTRGVLQATFELHGGALLTGFAVHFPAPFHPTAMRETAYRHLAELRDALPDDHHAFAAGDFNTTTGEVEQSRILDRLARPHWSIAHELGCAGCKGTHYYRRNDSWSYLDMIFWSPARGENATWQIRANSAWVANRTTAQVRRDGAPARFDASRGTGVSDHWPLAVIIEPAEKQSLVTKP